MKRVQRFVSVLVLVCFTFMVTGVAQAQTIASPSPMGIPIVAAQAEVPMPSSGAAGDSMSAGVLDGQMLAERKSTGGKLATGVGIGLLTGLIGTGIGYFVIGADEPSAEVLMRGQGRSADYQLGLSTGWEQKTKSRKRNAFLGGGLLGTAVFVAMVVAAGSGDD